MILMFNKKSFRVQPWVFLFKLLHFHFFSCSKVFSCLTQFPPGIIGRLVYFICFAVQFIHLKPSVMNNYLNTGCRNRHLGVGWLCLKELTDNSVWLLIGCNCAAEQWEAGFKGGCQANTLRVCWRGGASPGCRWITDVGWQAGPFVI